jgi:predicted esterase
MNRSLGISRSRSRFVLMTMFIALCAALTPTQLLAERDIPDDVLINALGRAGDNRAELERALENLAEPERSAMEFLIAYMPMTDLQTLDATFLINNVVLACDVQRRMPWGASVPTELFHNYVLPYANVSETREPWREHLMQVCLPIVASCVSPADAAQRLNEQLFTTLNVKYSTERARADQSPSESIDQGKASCTGLSILLVNACRSVGVPARLVGIPEWANKPGNHTWVEVWSDDAWHFVGAAEPDARGLNHAWFVHDASLARADDPRHSIYATQWAPTGLTFPMVWAEGADPVPAVNVTTRYVNPAAPDEDHSRVYVRIVNSDNVRIATPVKCITAQGAHALNSRDESFDTNDLASCNVLRGTTVRITLPEFPDVETLEIIAKDADTIITMTVNAAAPTEDVELDRLRADLRGAWSNPLWGTGIRPPFQGIEHLATSRPEDVRRVIWDAYRASPIHAAQRKAFEANRVRAGEYESPFTMKTIGKRPDNGWPLVIAMHGGGGAPQEVNDSQWRHMQVYYREVPDVGGYKYCALRAPTNEWNGFYTDYVYPLIEQLIRNALLFEEIDPDRVHLIGYSHGGYGAFAIGPKMPDRFASIHASAAAPTDGETSARTLRTVRFTCMIGERDTAYGRIDRCRAFAETLRELRDGRTDIYPATVTVISDHGHGGLPDRDMIRTMHPVVRRPHPHEVLWEQTDSVITHFYWLSDPTPGKSREILATCRDNIFTLQSTTINPITLHLDERLVDLSKPVTIRTTAGETLYTLTPTIGEMVTMMAERGDPRLMSSCRLVVPLK